MGWRIRDRRYAGHGDSFVLRDPNGIRPAYYYKDDEVVVVASERPAIQTAFNVGQKMIKELDPGNAIVIKSNGTTKIKSVIKAKENKSCSFERIYFSREMMQIFIKKEKISVIC